MLFAVPDSLDLRTAALTEPLAVTLRGVWHSGAQAGDSVVVMGAGPIGLLATRRCMPAESPMCVVEPNPDRRRFAERFGSRLPRPTTCSRGRRSSQVGTGRARLYPVMRRCSRTRWSVLGYAGTVVIPGITVGRPEIYTMLLAVNG